MQSGHAAAFAVTATGTPPLSYQWSRNGTIIGGATGATYNIAAVGPTDGGASFTVVVSNSAGNQASAAAVLTVTYAAASGVAQKGPLQQGSTVTAQELDATLSPTGLQYTYQITSDFGTFSPTSTFTSHYIGLNASGYYFDEAQNAISTGPVTLNGYNDLSTESVLNVNLLTTLAYQRIQHLISASGMTFGAAKAQAEGEVLAALNIPFGSSYGGFGTLDLSMGTDGDHMLAAVSSIFTYGNSAGQLSALIASAQSDIGTNGAISNPATTAALTAASAAINPGVIATNLTQKYSSAGITFSASDLAPWLDQDGDGLVGRYKYQVNGATAASSFSIPAGVVSMAAGLPVTVSTGQLSVNGNIAAAPVTLQAADLVTIAPGSATFSPSGTLTVYLTSGTQKLARVLFVAPDADVWLPAARMTYERTYTTATLLQNGKVLVAGGVGSSNAFRSNAELYDPSVGAWSPTGSLLAERYYHTATLLQSGKVLIVAGFKIDQLQNTVPTDTAEVYDPVTGTWAAAGTLSQPRTGQTATLLADGKVLVAGGQDTNGGALATADLYDPVANSWSPAAPMSVSRLNHTATLLPSGLVLVAGGNNFTNGNTTLANTELYNPATNTWSPSMSMTAPRANHTETLLANGKVLLVGGFDNNNVSDVTLDSADIYDPTTNTWSSGGSLTTARLGHSATLLQDGRLLVAGGYQQSNTAGPPLSSSEVYDPSTNSWKSAADLQTPRDYFSAVLLNSGGVLAIGGQTCCTAAGGTVLDTVEIYW